MKVWTHLEGYSQDPKKPLVLALGNFDGVHRGHQKIIESVIRQARKSKGIPAVLTFNEHPQRVLHRTGKPALLTSPQHRLLFFDEMGIEVCFLLSFTLEFSRTKPEEFVEKWLVGRLKARAIHLGYNAHFGVGRKGDGALMKKLSEPLNFGFFEVPSVKIRNEFVSSTVIREAVLKGDLEAAGEFLGRPFRIFATVVRGKGRGKSLGFPTANLQPHSEILPPRGVYPVKVRVRTFHFKPVKEKKNLFEYQKEKAGDWHHGILNLGVRPTFEKASEELVPEVHLLDFEGDLYGKTVEVIFYPRLREEKRFQTPEELIRAIQKDSKSAQRFFSALPSQRG